MKSEEKEAQKLIKDSLSKDAPSYEDLRLHERTEVDDPYTGFMHYYLEHSTTYRTMSTTADLKVTMKLAFIDKEGDIKNLSSFQHKQ